LHKSPDLLHNRRCSAAAPLIITSLGAQHSKVHDPEKWIPVSRLREALASPRAFRLNASAGEARSDKIMRK
jgi:hypothetical protein